MTSILDAPAEVTANPQPRRRGIKDRLLATGFILPAYAMYVIFLIVPLVLTVALSFTSWDGFDYGNISFNGIDNYKELVHDDVFLQSLVHNLWFLFASVVVKTGLALALAIALNRGIRLRTFFQGVFLVPAVLSLIVVGMVFQLLLDPNNGIINPLLGSIGLDGLAGAWFGDPNRALPILISMDVWIHFGMYMFIFLAAMASLPKEVSEAAAVDGVSPWQETRHVTIPMLLPAIKMVALLAAIESLKVFATVYSTTNGGPDHATEVLSTWGFFQAFQNNRVGYGNAILVVLLIVTFALSFLYSRSSKAERKGVTR
jgi:raffinose/stachyose/melibiose transport system permease protein